ncbi:hypothetical protein [Flavobacterium sp. JP2137]|uniref:hypothetical protein n=1 Tax=Flavobacterium sp. JP2137 TaxID=3414510 RepID=UPI003D2FC4DC
MRLTAPFDGDQNQFINFVVDKRSQPPASPVEAQLYYNTATKYIMRYDGTSWRAIGGILDITNTDGSIAITIADGVAALNLNLDNTTIEVGNNVLRLKDGGVSAAKLASNSVTTVKVTDKNITFAKINDIPTMTVMGRVVAGTGVAAAIPIINSNDLSGASGASLVTSGAVKAYIDANIASIGRPQGGWDAATNTVFPGTALTKNGDYWRVTVAGTIQGNPFQVGDVIQAFKDNPVNTNPNDYILLQTNTDQATTTVMGMVVLSTNAEVQAGTNNTKAVTPAGLSSRTATETRTGIAAIASEASAIAGEDDTTIMTPKKVKAVFASLGASGYVASFGDTTATTYTISHGLNTEDVIAEFFDLPSKAKILADYSITNSTTIQVPFSKAPGLNKIGVKILKVK